MDERDLSLILERYTIRDKKIAPKKTHIPENYEISINYMHNREKMD